MSCVQNVAVLLLWYVRAGQEAVHLAIGPSHPNTRAAGSGDGVHLVVVGDGDCEL